VPLGVEAQGLMTRDPRYSVPPYFDARA